MIDGEVDMTSEEELAEALRSMIAMDWEQGGREACEALRVRYLRSMKRDNNMKKVERNA